jgi:hypothetical protein
MLSFHVPDKNYSESWFRKRTDEHFAWPVESLTDLKEPIRQIVLNALDPGELPVYMIDAPIQGRLAPRSIGRKSENRAIPWEFSPGWLLVFSGQRLLLIRKTDSGEPPMVIPIRVEQILSMQHGTVLLSSWLEVCWGENNAIRRETIYFNAVCEKFFARLIAFIRQIDKPGPPDHLVFVDRNLNALSNLPYKFNSLLRQRVLLPNEKLMGVVFRPALYRKFLFILRRMTEPRLVAALTTGWLVIAEEDLTGREGSYGFIVRYLPRQNICQTEVIQQENGWALCTSLKYANSSQDFRIFFPPEGREPLLNLTSQF